MNKLLQFFDELCDLSALERDARLFDIETNDAELASQLRAMLRADRITEPLVAHDIEKQPLLGAALWHSSAAPSDFGPFHLLRELGSGGMGVVWLAERRLGDSKQLVAIKFVRHNNSPALLKHFDREREALARLEHPNIARLIDAGVGPDGAPYIATEYVDGTPLLDYARANALDLPARLQLLEELCEAVDYAHRRLVVHRDIKPSNILVDSAGRVRLLDFGIAKALDAGVTEQTQSAAMSPAYAAPEQALGEPISTATDVFGIGLVMFELLTGQLPAQRRALTAGDMVHRIANETIEAPSLSDFAPIATIDAALATRDWPKMLRGDVDLIVLKALKREPARRYASALALADDLRCFRAGRPITARPDSNHYRLRMLIKRNPWTSAASLLGGILIVGLGVVATNEAANARQAAEQTASVNAFFFARLGDGRASEQAAGTSFLHKDWMLAALPKLDTELASAPKARALLRTQFGGGLRALGETDAAINALNMAVVECEAAFGDSLETADALAMLASTLVVKSEFKLARSVIDKSIVMLDRLPRTDAVRSSRVPIMTTLLRVQSAEGDYAAALVTAQQNVQERAALYGADDPRLAVDYNNLSSQLVRAGRLPEAEQANDRAMALILAQPNPPAVRVALLERATCSLARQRGHYERALAACGRAHERLIAAVVGANHPETVEVVAMTAAVKLDMGAFEDARRLLYAPEIQQNPTRNIATQLARLETNARDWQAVLRHAAPFTAQQEVESQLLECYRRLAQWMLAPSAPEMAQLSAATTAVQQLALAPKSFRARAAAVAFIALRADHRDADAQAQKDLGLGWLSQDMDAAIAEVTWQKMVEMRVSAQLP